MAGNLLSKGSSANRIIEFAKSVVGHLPGGLPMAAIFASIIFAAVSGSSPATVVAKGFNYVWSLSKSRYPKIMHRNCLQLPEFGNLDSTINCNDSLRCYC